MSHMKSLALALLLFSCAVCFAQTGQIRGRVVSKVELEPLTGVNVLLQGTLRGTTTNANGEFLLSGIPAGRYSLAFSLIGYQHELVPDVEIRVDSVLEFTIELTPVPIQTAPVVVTASKREQSLQDIPISISLMESHTIESHNFVSVEDALRYVPGVNLTESQVSIRGSSGYSRGAGSRVLMLVDGIPLLTGDTGELNFESIPIGQVDRIEVLKGAGSALYGSNALGGVINVIMKPIPQSPSISSRIYGGLYGGSSYASWDWGGGTRSLNGVALSYGERFGETGILAYGSRFSDDGYRQNDYRRRYNGYLKLRHDFSSFDAVTTTFSLLHQRRASFLNWKDLDNALVPADVQQGDWVRSTRFFLSSQYQHVVSKDAIVAVRGMWYRNRFEDSIDTTTHRSESDVLRGEGLVTWSIDPSHILTIGLEGNIENVDADLFGDRSGFGGALYAQDEITINKDLQLTLGTRVDLQDLDSLESDGQVNPKATLLYRPSTGTTLRASFGRGFRSPSVAEAFVRTSFSVLTVVPNPALKSERSYSYELGVNRYLGETALLDLAVFWNDFSNLIEPLFTTGTTVQFTNVTSARIQGVEIGFKADLFDKSLFLDFGYTFVYPRDRTRNDILKYRPRHLLYTASNLQLGLFTLGADFRYLSRVERIDEAFTGFIPDAAERVPIYVVDLRFGADFTTKGFPLSAVLNIRNLFQYNYVVLVGNMDPPRTFILTLEAKM